MKSTLIVVIAALFLGFMLGWSAHTPPAAASNDIQALISQMKPGDTLVLDEKDLITGGVDQHDSYEGPGRSRMASEKKWYDRGGSWFGLGGPEAAAGDKGINGDDFQIGESRGPTIFARIWNSVKSIFWVLAFSGVGLVAVYFLVPAARPVISMIWKWVLGILTAGLSWIVVHAKQGAALVEAKTTATNLQAAVDNFPSLVQALPARQPNELGEGFTQGQKDTVVTLHQSTHTA